MLVLGILGGSFLIWLVGFSVLSIYLRPYLKVKRKWTNDNDSAYVFFWPISIPLTPFAMLFLFMVDIFDRTIGKKSEKRVDQLQAEENRIAEEKRQKRMEQQRRELEAELEAERKLFENRPQPLLRDRPKNPKYCNECGAEDCHWRNGKREWSAEQEAIEADEEWEAQQARRTSHILDCGSD